MSNIKRLDKEVAKVKKKFHVIKKNKSLNAKVKSIAGYAKGLDPESLLLFMAKFMILISGSIHRKKLVKLLSDSDIPTMGVDMDLLLEELYYEAETPLKLRDLLE
ncbi:MAG: hypothetical protein DRG78_23545 [Epsilonproteobacteria bacterium]|nr:MAG: hypothetical protein DRG78_23545 [Campylobacterota bacterium]